MIMHSPGRSLFTADTLSRTPVSQPLTMDKELQDVTDAFVNIVVMQNLPISEKRLEEIQQHQTRDPICTQLKAYCKDGVTVRAGSACASEGQGRLNKV